MNEKNTSKVSVLLARSEYLRFDAYCTSKGFKKSTLIARLVREHLAAEKFQMQQIFTFEKIPPPYEQPI